MKNFFTVISLLLSVSAVANTTTQDFTLRNGMQVVVQEDHRAPTVVSQVWYRAGGLDEVNGKTGVAHALEHMMFKGTPTVPAGQFSRQIAAVGGRENAFTSADYTCYFQQLEKSQLALSFKLEADRMQNLLITPEEFNKEIQVVMEERRWRTEDKPQSKVYEALLATSYHAHPYARPVIGFMNDLENMTYQDARDWYATWYAPNNAILVVVGDVNTAEVLALAEQYFGSIPSKILPARKPQREPIQSGERRIVIEAPGKLSYLMLGYHVPVLKHPASDLEPYALEVLAGILSGNSVARLPQRLVREQGVAVNVSANYDSVARGQQGLFLLNGTLSENKTMAELEAALLTEIERIQRTGVSEEELARVKAGVIASNVYQRDAMFYQAMQLGMFAINGFQSTDLKNYPDKLQAVGSADVQAVAQKYLQPNYRTVAMFKPLPLEVGQVASKMAH